MACKHPKKRKCACVCVFVLDYTAVNEMIPPKQPESPQYVSEGAYPVRLVADQAPDAGRV